MLIRHKTCVKIKIYFEKINFTDSSIIILKGTIFLFSNVDNEKKIKNHNTIL